MRKIFMLCLAGALALAAASCKEDKKVVTLQTITVSGQMYEVKSAFYTENPAEEGGEAGFMLGLFPTVLTTIPEEEPSFYVGIEISESLCGKTIDLTKPIVKSGTLEPYLGIIASADGTTIEIDNSEGSIDISVQEADSPLTVTSGTLKVTKNGGDFSVKFFVNLSDGRYIATDWKGTAKKVEIPG